VTLRFYLNSISGLFSTNPIKVSSVTFGGDDPNGILTPSDVVLVCTAGAHSPKLLQALVNGGTHKVVINGYRPNAVGLDTNFVRITLVGARVMSYQTSGSTGGAFTDRLHFNFATLEFDDLDSAVDYIWQAPV
jgi:type VI protein secretion system component Hcp